MRRAVPALAPLLPLIALALAPIPALAATPGSPPTLTGEVVSGGQPTVQATCTPGGPSTISYSSSGGASGPYPGTYVESGSATFTPTPGPLTSFQANFRIESSVGLVTGTKTLAVGSAPGICIDGPILAVYRIRAVTTYQTRITRKRQHGRGHVYSDSGGSSMETQAAGPPGNITYGSGFLNEYYTSSQATTTPVKSDREDEEDDQDSDRDRRRT